MVQQFETIYVEHMHDLPIVNKALAGRSGRFSRLFTTINSVC